MKPVPSIKYALGFDPFPLILSKALRARFIEPALYGQGFEKILLYVSG